VRFEIGPRGQVVSAERMGESKADPTLERCILDAVKALRFPAPEGGGYVTVTYPFLVHITGG
jgi:TonB family protein